MNRATYATILRSRKNPYGTCKGCGIRCGYERLHCDACMAIEAARITCPDCKRVDWLYFHEGRCTPCSNTFALAHLTANGATEEQIALFKQLVGI